MSAVPSLLSITDLVEPTLRVRNLPIQSMFRHNEAGGGPNRSNDRTNLIINYLPQGLNDQELYKMFIPAGPIKTCRIMKDLKTGYSYGFGFVEYSLAQDAARAIELFNNLAVEHKRIKVSYARPPGEDIKEANLYIQNIPRQFSEETLQTMFSPFGTIVQKNLLRDKNTGYPRGVGFVRFDKKSEADAAMAAMNGKIPVGGVQPLIVKVAEEHGKMKGSYYQGFQAGINSLGKIRGQQRGMPQQQPLPPPFGRASFPNSGGKIAFGRTSNRYNPIGGGGGYGGDYSDYSDYQPPRYQSDSYSDFSSY